MDFPPASPRGHYHFSHVAFCPSVPLPASRRNFATAPSAPRLPRVPLRKRQPFRARLLTRAQTPPTPPPTLTIDAVFREVRIRLQDPYVYSVVLAVAAVVFCLGWLLASSRRSAVIKRLRLAAAKSAVEPMAVSSFMETEDEVGDNALWLNLSLFPSVWRLFRKNTATLISETLQPILDEVDLPPFVKRVEIRALTIGSRPPLVRKIRRLPSRARSELQYSFRGRLTGDLRVDLDVTVNVMGARFNVPVTLTDLDLDAHIWTGFSLMPGPPWLRRLQWALLKLPSVKLNLRIAKVLPVTAIPVLANVLDRVFTKSIPKEFLFPKTQIVDLQDAGSPLTQSQSMLDLADAVTVTADGEFAGSKDADFDVLRQQYPALWALFDSMDVDGDGALSPEEVVTGLSADWGFASTSPADKVALFNLLDENDDGKVDFREFIAQWPDLRNVFVPRRFNGVIAGVLQKAKELPVPRWGYSDPYVVFSVEGTSHASRKNFETSKRGKLKGDAVWNESWELQVENPDTAFLKIEVREGSPIAFGWPQQPSLPPPKGSNPPEKKPVIPSPPKQEEHRGKILGTGRLRVSKLLDGKPLKIWVPLDAGTKGRLLLDLSYAQYVDPKPL